MPREVILEAVGDDLGLREDARERRQVAAEQVLDERKVRAAEDGPVRGRAAGLREHAADALLDKALELGFGRLLLDGAGESRADLLHDDDACGQRLRISSG